MPPKPTKAVATPVTSNLSPKENRYLPSKEAVLFAQVLQLYETKQWSKGLKAADTILKTRPDHGETLAMKGLFLSCLTPSDKKEAYHSIKQGVRMDMGSHIVWHVYGLVHRSDKNWEEALKCYVQANKIEKDSLNILGDLASLAIHLRNYSTHLEARHNILRLNPRLRRNWIGLAVAQHLASQNLEACRTLLAYEEMLRDMPAGEYEHSEALLYHAYLLEEGGEFEQAIEFLGEHTGEIVDRTAYSVQRAHLLLKLGRMEPAEWAWELLLEENPDSYEYIGAYVKAKGADVASTTEEGKAASVKVLDALTEKYPRSLAIRRIALDLASGDDFRSKASKYLTNALAKGVPSLFADVKSLYSDPSKRDIIGELVEGYRSSLESSSNFTPSPSSSSSAEEVESTAAYLWTLFFLSQHYSALSQHALALETLALAEKHTPSLPELAMLKARVLKRAGDAQGALDAMSEARALDGQDRFLNSKNAKYFIRAGRIDEAEKVLGLFTKKDAMSPLDDLVDMQGLWVLQEEGMAYANLGNYALALKRYQQMFDIFNDVEEDQYDFHTYCMRKMTLRAYINLLRYVDQLRSHPRYFGAAKGAIEIYLRLHDDPSALRPPPLTNGAAEAAKAEESAAAEKATAEAEKKKADEEQKSKKPVVVSGKDKGKKAAGKKSAAAAAAKEKEEEEHVEAPVVDQDPKGEKLLATEKPLEEAVKWLRPLEKVAADKIGTWLLSFEVAVRREKYLEALRALRTAHAIDPSSPALHVLLVRFSVLLSTSPAIATLPEAVRTTLTSALEALIGSDVEAYMTSTLQKNAGDPEHVLAGAKAVWVARNEGGKAQVEELVFQLLREELGATYKHAVAGLEVLNEASSSRIDEFRSASAERFPLSSHFQAKGQDDKSSTKTADGDSRKEILED